MSRSYYSETIEKFLVTEDSKILGMLVVSHVHALEDLQRNAWMSQIKLLKSKLLGYSGYIFFEFSIPRMGKRVDNIIIINDIVFVVEFKIDASKYDNFAIEQITDYSLDLKNFHEGSHKVKLIPILIATNAPDKEPILKSFEDHLYEPLLGNVINFKNLLDLSLKNSGGNLINGFEWENSLYKPTPTIIEAAQALYKGHNVKDISRSDSGAKNLSLTANCISEIIEKSKKYGRRSICFVTGVPGAGKTLAGLNITSIRTKIDENEHAVFLSGNGPLVDVLREALARDKVLEAKNNNIHLRKNIAESQVKSFIQNIHHFRDDALNNTEPPLEKVVVFDEAQRAWTKKQASKFMKQKKNKSDFNMSEPEFLIEVMNRHNDWCTIICLVGGGQEINTGEAGLDEWIKAFENRFSNWDLFYSPIVIQNKNYLKDKTTINKLLTLNSTQKNELHLEVSVRSFRAEKLSDLIENIIDLDIHSAASTFNLIKLTYPIKITRNLNKAKEWLKNISRGSERYGLIGSSGGYRLRAEGINVKAKVNAPIWFLNEKDDVRSSYFLEEIGTEFDIQGLELDWTCVAWDIDFFYHNKKWNHRKFKGTKWQNINNFENIEYLSNTYRVLLTRARQGMIIYLPNGSSNDKTRTPEFYDSTYELLKSIGFEEI